MAIKYSIDQVQINEYKQKTRVTINGWCASLDGEIPSLLLEINGKKVKYSKKPIVRADAVKVFKIPASAEECGFMLHVRDIASPVHSLKLTAITEKEQRVIALMNDSIISTVKESHSFLASVDGFTFDENFGMLTITGWAIPENEDELHFDLYKDDEFSIPCKVRKLCRKDLVDDGFVDAENQMCGFYISYPCKAEPGIKLKIFNSTDTIEFPIETGGGTAHLGALKSLLVNLNANTLRKAIRHYRQFGFLKTIQRLKRGYSPEEPYHDWLLRHRVTKEELDEQKEHHFDYTPKISLIVPTFNTPLDLLSEMIDTVIQQSYPNWELCIADGSKPDSKTREKIKEYSKQDNRIKVVYLDKNYGISGNTNQALELATGDYTAMYDHDDFLELNAVYEIVKVLNDEKVDIVYTDEDKYSQEDKVFNDPNFKPDFSIDLLRSHNYITHLFVVKTSILKEIGGFRSEFDGSQDYDVILRCIEKTNKIYHLPKVLYHWRMVKGSTAEDPQSKMYCYEAGKKAIEEHLKREGIAATVSMLGKPYYGLYHVKYETTGNPLVSIVIPNYENKAVLKRCIDSLYKANNYKNFELIIVENNSKSDEIFAYYKELESQHDNVHVVTWQGKEFNYSAINNYGVQFAKGDYLLFLNNDTEVIASDAISEMLGCCMREEVGIVGAKLLFEDDTIQHAGVVIGIGGAAGHVFSRIKKDDAGYMMRPLINCNYSAVTAACMMVKKECFDRVGGFDEDLKVAYNDIDLCLKIRDLDKLVVYNAFALWHHYESLSRGYETSVEKIDRMENEIAIFQKRWHKILVNGDPYYNANFDVSYTPFKVH